MFILGKCERKKKTKNHKKKKAMLHKRRQKRSDVALKLPVFRGEGATAMFEVQIMSDLHLEFPNALANLAPFEPRAPYLVPLPSLNHLPFPLHILMLFF
jgi:hypothetical protein